MSNSCDSCWRTLLLSLLSLLLTLSGNDTRPLLPACPRMKTWTLSGCSERSLMFPLDLLKLWWNCLLAEVGLTLWLAVQQLDSYSSTQLFVQASPPTDSPSAFPGFYSSEICSRGKRLTVSFKVSVGERQLMVAERSTRPRTEQQ